MLRSMLKPWSDDDITPYRFETRDGKRFTIRQIQQVHHERVGKGFHYHYVVKTNNNAYFHLVFDTAMLTWRMIQEVDEQLFFNE